MASIWTDAKGYHSICFDVAGRRFRKALGTQDKEEAKARFGRASATLHDIKQGKLTIPEGADVGLFVLSEGRMAGEVQLPQQWTLGEMLEAYLEARQNLEPNTRLTLRIHAKHLLETFGVKQNFVAIGHNDLQRHVNRRIKTVSGTTAKKEIVTFRSVWLWAKMRKMISSDLPCLKLEYPKAAQKPRFQTWQQIERAIAKGGSADLWNYLWLDADQTNELLDYVRENARHPFIYPMFVMIAHTGCRRSEMLRSEQTDFDFENGCLVIREKKKKKEFDLTIRHVEMTQRLITAMQEWFNSCNGKLSICYEDGTRITRCKAHHHFKQTLKGSKWSVLRGFHVLRHSFISNFARKGIDQRLLDAYVGHTTDAMREHYRHLHPDQLRSAVTAVFGI
jgi:site-specific recombinase XerD